MFRKTLFSFLVVTFVAFSGFAHDEPSTDCKPSLAIASDPADIQAINEEIAKVLKEFNDNLTTAEIKFSRVRTSDTRAVDVQVSASYAKTGATGSFKADVRNLEYTYPEGGCVPSLPTLKIDAGLGFNLLSFFKQEEINRMGEHLEEQVQELVLDVVRDFGEAAKVDAKITRKNIDDAGNLTAVGAKIKIDIDKSKLPEGFDMDKLQFTSLEGMGDLSLTGLKLVLNVTMNPDHRSFKSDEQGLKEYLDSVRARDQKVMDEFRDMMSFVDRFANEVVNKKPDNGGEDEGHHHH